MNERLQRPFGRRNRPCHPFVGGNSHTHSATERFKYSLRNVVRVDAFKIVDMYGGFSAVREGLEELAQQVDIEVADSGARVVNAIEQAWPSGEIDDDAR